MYGNTCSISIIPVTCPSTKHVTGMMRYAGILLFGGNFQYVTGNFAGTEQAKTYVHQVLSAVYTVVAAQIALGTGHHVDFAYPIARVRLQTFEQNGVVALAPTGIGVEGEYHGALLICAHKLGNGVRTVVGRIQTEHVAVKNNGAQTAVILHGLLAIGKVVLAHVAQLDVESHLAHHGYVCAELNAGA